MSVLRQIPHPDGVHSFVVEDDDRVCYLYLLEGSRVVADVWLYNAAPAGVEPEWKRPDARSLMPFQNPPPLGRQDAERLSATNDIQATWNTGEAAVGGDLFVDGERIASLKVGDRPGRSRNAIKDGPLAKVLSPEGQA